jgi:hypothetical protein
MGPNYNPIFVIIPIGISLLALVTSAVSLGWNIYRDVVLKPRLKVRFALSTIVHSALAQPLTSCSLSATNFGPGSINCQMIQLRTTSFWRWLFRTSKHAVMIHDYENLLSAKLPAKLDVGEQLMLLIKYEKDCFLKGDTTHIGLSDSFGRIHWALAKDVKKTRQAFQKQNWSELG